MKREAITWDTPIPVRGPAGEPVPPSLLVCGYCNQEQRTRGWAQWHLNRFHPRNGLSRAGVGREEKARATGSSRAAKEIGAKEYIARYGPPVPRPPRSQSEAFRDRLLTELAAYIRVHRGERPPTLEEFAAKQRVNALDS